MSDNDVEVLPAEIVVHEDVPPSGALAIPNAESQPADFIEWRMGQIKKAFDDQMIEGIDYGYITNKSGQRISDKPTLFQPGAQHLLNMFELDAEPEIVSELTFRADDLSVVDLAIKMTCYHRRTGERVGASMGAGSSRESKWSRPHCPNCGESVFFNGPPSSGPDRRPDWKKNLPPYTCRDKSCGWSGQQKPPDAFSPDQFNTLVKMVEKRARVAVANAVTGASHFFSQDLESTPQAQDPGAVSTHAAPEGSGGGQRPGLSDPSRPIDMTPPLPPLQMTDEDRLEDGSFPVECPYCSGQVVEEEKLIKKGTPEERLQKFTNCTNTDCTGGRWWQGRRWPWSMFGSVEGSFKVGGRVDELVNAGGQSHEDIEVTRPDWDAKEYLRQRMEQATEWSDKQKKDALSDAKREVAHGARWTREVAQEVVLKALDRYYREHPTSEEPLF